MNSCSGPCLEHCYTKIKTKNKIEYILIGICIGIVISYIFNRNKKEKDLIGVRSSSTQSSKVLGVQYISSSNNGTTNVNTPSLILTATKIIQ